MISYADTSFMVSLYIRDRHSSEARKIVSLQPEIWFTPLHHAEWTHAVEQHVFRGVMSRKEADEVHRQLAGDLASGLWREVPLADRTFDVAVDLARRFVARTGTRTSDTLHVACALELKASRFWTFDERQAKLARAVGLRTT